MGRRAHSRPLSIWTNGEFVGHWTPGGRRPMELRYADNWLKSPSGRPLSLSLPLPLLGNQPLRGELVENFFENLLPESSAIRKRLAQRYAAGSEDTFDLLAAIGATVSVPCSSWLRMKSRSVSTAPKESLWMTRPWPPCFAAP